MDTIFTLIFYGTGLCLLFAAVTAALCIIDPSTIDAIRDDLRGEK